MSKATSGGSSKIGRNKVKCAKYKSEGRRERNKARHIKAEQKKQERAQMKRERREGTQNAMGCPPSSRGRAALASIIALTAMLAASTPGGKYFLNDLGDLP